MKVKIKRIDKSLPLPQYQTEGSVAFDMGPREDAALLPGEVKILPSNLIIEVPKGYALILAARSSLAKKFGLKLAHGIGVIDQDYHGPEDEIGLLLHNFTDKTVEVKRGDRLVQGMIMPIDQAQWIEVEEIAKESRGGFGSTG